MSKQWFLLQNLFVILGWDNLRNIYILNINNSGLAEKYKFGQ